MGDKPLTPSENSLRFTDLKADEIAETETQTDDDFVNFTEPTETTSPLPFRFEVESSDAGRRLDSFLATSKTGLSRSRLKALIEEGAVSVDGMPQRPAKLLKGGEIIILTPPSPKPVDLIPQNIPLHILFEDDDILVIDKAAGMVVHPGAGVNSGTVVNAVMFHCPDLKGIGGEMRPGIVHRLDKDTSGCLIIAKTHQALTSLQSQFQCHTTDKRYLALIHGQIGESGRFDTLHGRHPTDRLRFTSHVQRGRQAITEWTTLETFPSSQLLSVHLLTGRTHQIRMHFSEAGHPLMCDSLYGGVKREKKLPPNSPLSKASQALGRHALHAAQLSIDHPTTGNRMTFQAPIPPDFQAALDILRKKIAAISKEPNH